jgi:hypothetical protein
MSLNNGGFLSNGASGQGFASVVNGVQAIGVEGDFAAPGNPFSTVDAPNAGGFVAGELGVAVGAFAWIDATDGYTLDNFGAGVPAGFVHRAQQGVFNSFGTNASLVVPQGLPVAIMNSGDFYARNNGTVAATIGMKVYALNASGLATFNVTATPPSGATATGATLYTPTSAATGGALPVANTCTGSIAVGTNVLTVTAVGAGSVLGAGQTITGTGIDPAAVVSIVAQLPGGTLGGVGTYTISTTVSLAVASTTITLSGGGLTLTGANGHGIFAIGMVITGTNIPLGTTITGYGTATAGGAGTYTVSLAATTAATASTITATNASILTVDSSSTGTWGLGDLITGTTVTAQSIVGNNTTNVNLTGIGGAGTYQTNLAQASQLTAQTIGAVAGIETTWYATSPGAVGELVSIKNSLNV